MSQSADIPLANICHIFLLTALKKICDPIDTVCYSPEKTSKDIGLIMTSELPPHTIQEKKIIFTAQGVLKGNKRSIAEVSVHTKGTNTYYAVWLLTRENASGETTQTVIGEYDTLDKAKSMARLAVNDSHTFLEKVQQLFPHRPENP